MDTLSQQRPKQQQVQSLRGMMYSFSQTLIIRFFFISRDGGCGVAVDPACKENNQPSIINQRYNKYKDNVGVTFVKSVRLNTTYYLG